MGDQPWFLLKQAFFRCFLVETIPERDIGKTIISHFSTVIWALAIDFWYFLLFRCPFSNFSL
jgi:hypothetical protein